MEMNRWMHGSSDVSMYAYMDVCTYIGTHIYIYRETCTCALLRWSESLCFMYRCVRARWCVYLYGRRHMSVTRQENKQAV